MSKTIDQILSECRGEDTSSPEVFSSEKVASFKQEGFTDSEVKEMASFLKEASIEEETIEAPFIEKVAEALILSNYLNGTKSTETHLDSGLTEKQASFVKKAYDAGYNDEEINVFLEKQALAFNSRTAFKGLGMAAAGAGLAVGGKAYGENKAHKEDSKVIRSVGNFAYRKGRKDMYNTFRAMSYRNNARKNK